MKTVYLHIGMPKTGTSAVQKFLAENKAALKEKGYCYEHMPFPVYGKGAIHRNARFLFDDVYDAKGNKHPELKEKRLEEFFGYISEWIQTYDNVILTDEAYWNSLRMNQDGWRLFERLINVCKGQGAVVKIVVYLRRQDDYMLSWWRQRIRKGGNFAKFDDWNVFVENPPKVLVLDYNEHLERIEQYVGHENMIVRIYDRNGFVGKQHSVYSDFMDAIGLELTDDFQIKGEDVNVSMTDNFAEVKRILNELQGSESRMHDPVSNFFEKPAMICSGFSDFNERYSLMTTEDSRYIMNLWKESNEKVRERYFPEKEVLFPDKVVDKEIWTLDSPNMRDTIVLYFGQMALEQHKEIEELRARVEKAEKLVKENQAALRAMNKLTSPVKKIYKKIHKKK